MRGVTTEPEATIFFEPEFFHGASPRAGSNLLQRSQPVAGPPAGGGPLVHEELPWAPSLGLPGNGFSTSGMARTQWGYERVGR